MLNIKKVFIVVFIISIFLCSSCSTLQKTSTSAYSWKVDGLFFSQELNTLNQQIQDVQTGLKLTTGIEDLYICGGSARAILDHIYTGKVLQIRDLDIAVLAHRTLSVDMMQPIAEALERQKIDFNYPHEFSSRIRMPNHIEVNAGIEYVAGYGFFMLAQNGTVLDLSFFNNRYDLELNGLMDIDTTMILLRQGESLEQFVEKAKKMPLNTLIKEGAVLDPHHGYINWVCHNPNIIRWKEVEADPHLHVFRLVRSYTKISSTVLPKEISERLRHLCSSTKTKQSPRMGQYLFRVLDDKLAYKELKLLQELGIFQQWLPEFDKWLKRTSPQELAHLLNSHHLNAKEKWKILVLQLPKEAQLQTLFTATYKFYLKTSIEGVFELFSLKQYIDENHLNAYIETFSSYEENELLGILSIPDISDKERLDLLINTILGQEPILID